MALLNQVLTTKGRALHTIAPGDSVLDAIRRMAEHHIGALLVMEDQQLVGILSERDYARKVILKGRASADTTVRDIMTAPVVTATPDQSVEDAMRLMTENRFRHLPVAANGRVLGIVSIGDLVKQVLEDQRHTINDLRAYISGG